MCQERSVCLFVVVVVVVTPKCVTFIGRHAAESDPETTADKKSDHRLWN